MSAARAAEPRDKALVWRPSSRYIRDPRRTRSSEAGPSQGAVAKTAGVIAQLGERFNGIEEVRGSIPRGSTTQSSTNA